MQTYLKIVNFLEAHIELVKVFLYALSPVVAVCFRDFRAVIIKFLDGLFFIIAFPIKQFEAWRKNRILFKRFVIEVRDLPKSTQKLLLRFGVEGQYIEVPDLIKASRDVMILHDKGWIHGLGRPNPNTICIDLHLLPYVKILAQHGGNQ